MLHPFYQIEDFWFEGVKGRTFPAIYFLIDIPPALEFKFGFILGYFINLFWGFY